MIGTKTQDPLQDLLHRYGTIGQSYGLSIG